MKRYEPCSPGFVLAALSSFAFTLCSLIAKLLMLNPIEISCIGFLGILIVSAPFAFKRLHQLQPPKGYRRLFIARSIFGTIFLISSFRTVQLIPFGDASVLFSTAPVFTYILGSVFLKEPFTLYSGLMLFTLLTGVVLVTKPVMLIENCGIPSEQYILGASFGLLASFAEAIGNIILRKLNNFHFSIIMFNHGFLSLLQTLPCLIYFNLYTNLYEYRLIVPVLAVGTALEQLLVILALTLEQAGHVALIQASDIIYGYVFQVCFFNEPVEVIPMLGAAIVTAVIVHMAQHGRRQKEIQTKITV